MAGTLQLSFKIRQFVVQQPSRNCTACLPSFLPHLACRSCTDQPSETSQHACIRTLIPLLQVARGRQQSRHPIAQEPRVRPMSARSATAIRASDLRFCSRLQGTLRRLSYVACVVIVSRLRERSNEDRETPRLDSLGITAEDLPPEIWQVKQPPQKHNSHLRP